MGSLRVAAAQSISAPGDVAANVAAHCAFVAAAAAAGVDLLVFPELSLSGYEPELVASCCVAPGDPVVEPLRRASRSAGLTVVAGAPIASASERPFIGAVTFFPDGGSAVYRKQHLHVSEEGFACAGRKAANDYPLPGGETFGLAICADLGQERHAQAAASASVSLYVASVLLSERAWAVDSAALRGYAERFGFAVLMANHGAPSGPYVSAGRSACWAPGGELVVAAPGTGNLLVVAERGTDGWSGEILVVAT